MIVLLGNTSDLERFRWAYRCVGELLFIFFPAAGRCVCTYTVYNVYASQRFKYYRK